MGGIERAQELYERAVFGGDRGALSEADRELDRVEADLALARGRIVHARFLETRTEDPREQELFERAATLYRALGDARGEGEALFWLALVHQVVRGDHDAAVPLLERAGELARRSGDRLTESYVLRHLAFAGQAAGRPEAARELMRESTRIRRELGFDAGVAANLVALAHLAAGPDEAAALLDEAAVLASASGAHGVLSWVEEARQAQASK